MALPPFSASCLRLALRLVAIVLAGCGGSLAMFADGASDGGSDAPAMVTEDCRNDITPSEIVASIGAACSDEGAFCIAWSCNACSGLCGPSLHCTQGVWVAGANTAICSPSPDASASDASPSLDAASDGGACLEIGTSSFDQTCKKDSDCIPITVGTFCPNTPLCTCPVEAINVDGQSRYEARLREVWGLPMNGGTGPNCQCPASGTPRCLHDRCALCGGINACADGG